MDVLSHALVGRLFQAASRADRLRDRLVITFAAAIPDLPVLFVYLLLGREKNRPFWIPHNADWIGVREAHPVWSAMWEVPHSFLFVGLVLVPLVIYLKLPRLALASYCSHIVLDIPTHTGEWSVKPLYPFPWLVEGFTDAWAWPIRYMAVSWVILTILIIVAERLKTLLQGSHSKRHAS